MMKYPVFFTQLIRQAKASFPRRSACCWWAAEIFPCGFDFHYKYLDSGHTRPPVLTKRSWFISLFSAQVKNSIKTVQNILQRQALVIQCIKRPLDYDDTSFINWLPDDYNITALQENFPYYAKNGQKPQYFTIYNEHKQRQTKYSFFYLSKFP